MELTTAPKKRKCKKAVPSPFIIDLQAALKNPMSVSIAQGELICSIHHAIEEFYDEKFMDTVLSGAGASDSQVQG